MQYKVSIIVPVYNVEQYLEECIESILNQTLEDIEIILVNDGSTDRSLEICERYQEKDNRIKLINKSNGGLSSARNEGIKVASGQYIGFVDSDDYIHTEMYEILFNNAIKYKSDIVISKFKKFSDEDYEYNAKDIIPINYKIENFNYKQSLYQLYTERNVEFVIAWNKIYKKDLFNNLKFEEGRICEDEFMAHKILYKSKITTYVHIDLYYYRQRINSIMTSKYSIKNLDAVYALQDRVEFFYKINNKDLLNISYRYYIEMFIGNYLKAKTEINNSKNELKKLKKSFNLHINKLFFNPYYNWKEKVLLYIFYINPYLYEKYNRY